MNASIKNLKKEIRQIRKKLDQLAKCRMRYRQLQKKMLHLKLENKRFKKELETKLNFNLYRINKILTPPPKTFITSSSPQHIFQRLSKRYVKQGIMLTPMDLWSMAKKQKAVCALSGRSLKSNISIDHIIPKSKGGTNDKSNIRLVNLDVNVARGNKSDSEFINLCQSVVNYNNIKQ